MDFLAFWWTVTTAGDPLFISAAVAALFLLYLAMRRGYVRYAGSERHRAVLKAFLLVAIPALAVSLAGTEALKLLFHVPRPCVPCPADGCIPYCTDTFSFPSAHAAASACIAAAVFFAGSAAGRRRKLLAVYAFPLLVGASRVVLGVHTAYDVTAGLAFGVAVTALVWKYAVPAFFRKRV